MFHEGRAPICLQLPDSRVCTVPGTECAHNEHLLSEKIHNHMNFKKKIMHLLKYIAKEENFLFPLVILGSLAGTCILDRQRRD